SYISTDLRLQRAAFSAASFTMLESSAPENPGAPRARIERSTSSANGILRVWTRRISSRPRTSGSGTTTRRSKRPGRSNQDHAFVRFKAVHLNQQLVQGLLALIMPTAQTRATMATNGVNFVDEDDAGSILFALLKEIAYATCAHANEHFYEVRTGDAEERNIGFAGYCPRQQGLACARMADQQNAFGNATAELLEFLGFAQELNDFPQLFFGFIHASYVFEGNLLLLHGKQAGTALPEA